MSLRWAAGLLAAVLGVACGGSPATARPSGSLVTAPSSAPATGGSAGGSMAGGSPAATGPGSAASGSVTPAGCPPSPPATPPPSPLPARFPTALRFAPDGRLFVTERAGTIRVWEGGELRSFATLPTVTTEPGGGYSERGLLGLALSPTFSRDHFVYVFVSDPDRVHQRVVRFLDCGGVGTEETTIVTLPAGPDCCHKGGRLAFGPDGKLYVSLGDEHDAPAAQDVHDPRGKILRYNPDGSVPLDDPFGPGDPVWAYGLRNPFGLGVAPDGHLVVSDNGPSGDAGSPSTGYDRILLDVQRGGGYQWPLCYGYSHPLEGAGCGGQAGPDWSSEESTVVPTGVAIVGPTGPSAYAGRVVVCTYAAGMLVVSPGSPHAVVGRGSSSCRLDVTQAPDGSLWVADQTEIVRVG